MYIRPKTKRRLLILGSTSTLLLALLLTGFFVRRHRLNLAIAHARSEAMAAHHAGEHAQALKSFSYYLDESKTATQGAAADAEAILAYAQSRAAVELPKGKHLVEAEGILELYHRLRPRDAAAVRMLLDIQPRIGFNREAIDLADEVLASDASDVTALRAKVHAHRNLAAHDRKHFELALDSSLKLNEAEVTDVAGQIDTLRLMLLSRRPEAEAVARAEALRASHRGDVRFDLILASAHLFTRQSDPAAPLLQSAASAEPPDAVFAIELSRQLQASHLFALSHDVIERALKRFPADPDLCEDAALIRWQTGRFNDVLACTQSADGGQRDASPALAGLRALALIALDRTNDAKVISAALARRTGDQAAGWSSIIEASLIDPGSSAKLALRVAAIQRGLDRDPHNSIALYYLGDAYGRLGEIDLALQAFESAARRSPEWAMPIAMSGRLLEAQGLHADAAKLLQAAYARAPGDLSIAADYVVAAHNALADLDTDNAAARRELLAHAQAIQKDLPDEPRTFPIYLSLLVESGQRDRAAERLQALIRSSASTPPELIAQLILVSAQHAMGFEDALWKRADRKAWSPASCASVARALLATGHGEAGALLLQEQCAAAARLGSDALLWEIALLDYRASRGDQSAAADWEKLAQARNEPVVIDAILHSPARFQSRGLWKRAIDQQRKSALAESQGWMIEQAQFVLSNDQPSDSQVDEVIALLDGTIKSTPAAAQPRHWLARAFLQRSSGVGNDQRRQHLDRAAEEISYVAKLRPNDLSVSQDLLTILVRASRRDAAIAHVDQLAAAPEASINLQRRLWMSNAYLQLNQPEKAMMLAARAGKHVSEPAVQSQIALIHARQGRFKEAELIYRTFLTGNLPDADTLISAAEFFTDRGQIEAADQCLARVAKLDVQPSLVSTLHARLAERRGDAQQACAHFINATQCPDASAGQWRELVGFLLRNGRASDAAAAADAAVKAVGVDRAIQQLGYLAKEFEKLKAIDPAADPAIVTLSREPGHAAALAMLEAITQPNASASSIAQGLQEAAAEFEDYLPLQTAAARALLAKGEIDPAMKIARRAAGQFPDAPAAMRLLTEVYSSQKLWSKALDAAIAWRALVPAQSLEADLAIATANIETGDAAAALQRLAPYRSTFPVPFPVTALVSRAQIKCGQADLAAATLAPLAKESDAACALWRGLASDFPDAASAAKWLDSAPAPRRASDADAMALARAWLHVAERFADQAAAARAVAILSPLEARLEPAGQSVLALAAQAAGDFDRAVAAHRKVLAANPHLPAARNNLAYILMLRGREDDAPEARRLARDAVADEPQNAAFRDTLARIDANEGQLDAAIAGFRQAIDSNPASVEAKIGLADALVRTARPAEAQKLCRQIGEDLQYAGVPPTYLSKQWSEVKKKLSQPDAAGGQNGR